MRAFLTQTVSRKNGGMRHILRVASYHFRTTFRRRWAGYVSLMLLIALVGGLSMASLAGARKTDSSFITYIRSTNVSSTMVATAFDDPMLGLKSGYDPSVNRKIAHLPLVEETAVSVGF